MVNFHDMGQYAGTSVFCTSDNELAKALETHPGYNNDFYLAEGQPQDIEKPISTKHEFDKVYAHINKTQEAITVLVQKHGCSRDDIKSMFDVVRKAKELNVSFPQIERHLTRYAKK